MTLKEAINKAMKKGECPNCRIYRWESIFGLVIDNIKYAYINNERTIDSFIAGSVFGTVSIFIIYIIVKSL